MKYELRPREIRGIRKPYTRKEFAALLGVTTQAIYLWESGAQKPSGPVSRLLWMLGGRMRKEVLRWLSR